MTQGPSAAVARAIAASEQIVDNDLLTRLQNEARKARDLELTVQSLTEQLNQAKAQLKKIYSEDMVNLMDEAGVDFVGLPPEGNYSGRNYKLRNDISANIAAKWPEEKREAAFRYLKEMNAEDLIKTEVVAYYPRGGLKAAQELLSQLKKSKVKSELSKTVPHGTLGAWLRELIEKHKVVPPPDDLEKIGGYIGRIVKVEEREDG